MLGARELGEQFLAHLLLFSARPPPPSSGPSPKCAFEEGPLGLGGTSRLGRGLLGGS